MRCQGPSPSSYWMVRAPGPAWAQKEQLNVTAQLTHAANDPRLRPLQPARRRLLAWLSGQLCVQSLWRNKRFLSCEGSLTGFYRVVFEALGCISAKTMWFQEPLAPVVAEANEHAIAMIILRSSESPRTTRNDNTRQPAGLCSQHVAHVHPPPHPNGWFPPSPGPGRGATGQGPIRLPPWLPERSHLAEQSTQLVQLVQLVLGWEEGGGFWGRLGD